MPASASQLEQINLVSSRLDDDATLFDPNFINAWGLALRPAGFGGHWWIANTDTSRVTLYIGDSPTVPFGQDGLSVLGVPGAPADPTTIPIDPPQRDGEPLPPPNPTPATIMPPSNPTGQVYSGSNTDFLVSGTSLTGQTLTNAPARFITVSEDGTIAAWGETGSTPAQRMNAFVVVADNSETGAIYKGVTTSAESGSGNQVFAANFSQGRIDVFDANWQPVATTGFDPVAPGGRNLADYAPFNIERVFDASRGEEVLIVAYAKVANAAEGEEEPTDGFIAKFTIGGEFVLASDAGGLFSAPWGVALSPGDFGAFSGSLLVGNFGDGMIVSLDIETLEPEGLLLDADGNALKIDGLWDLAFGNGASLGRTDRLYFTAGPDEESHGLFGGLSAGEGEDQAFRFRGSSGDDIKSGASADDTLKGRAGDDTLLGQRGDDRLDGGSGDDRLFGGQDEDTLNGGSGNDSLYGGRGDDVLKGASGNDSLLGGHGDDWMRGGGGDDSLEGGEGNDFLKGGAGADLIFGSAGRDRLKGDGGNDRLDGGAGEDCLSGGSGKNTLTGGDDADVFVMDGGRDVITDFEVGVDHIRIDDCGVHRFGDLRIRADADGDAVVRWNGGEVTLEGVSVASVTPDLFWL